MTVSTRPPGALVAATVVFATWFAAPHCARGQARGPEALVQATQLLERGRFKAAEEMLESVLRSGGNGQAEYLLGFALINLYRFDEAEGHLRRAVADQPENVARLHSLAKSLLEQNKNLAAIGVLDRAIGLEPRADFYFARAMCALNAGRNEAAERDLEASLSVSPGNPEALYKLGRLAMDRGDYASGRERFLACLAINPRHLEARFSLGVAELWIGNRPRSIEALQQVLSSVPGHVGALYNLSRAFQQSGQPAAARSTLEEFRRMSATQDEVDFLRQAVVKNPDNVDGRIVLAQKLLEIGKAEDALKEALAARQLAPRRALVYRVIAGALERLGRDQDARQATEFARSLDEGP